MKAYSAREMLAMAVLAGLMLFAFWEMGMV